MNKPKWSKTLICVVISSIICCIGALAVNNRITIDLPDITILVNGEEFIAKDEDGVVVQPILYNGTTYVPLRAIEELNGKFVDWDGDTNTVLIDVYKRQVYSWATVALKVSMSTSFIKRAAHA